MASNNNVNGNGGGKEERRRRIAERGSDRMALITGRIHNLPPTPPSPTTTTNHHHNHNHRQPPRHAQSLSYHSDSDNHLPSRHSRPHSLSPAFYSDYNEEGHTGAAVDKHDASISSSRLKHQAGFKYSNFDNFDRKSEVEPLIHEDSDTIAEFNHQVSEGDGAKTSRTHQNGTLDIKQQRKIRGLHNKPTFFSSRELNSCIIASEITRALSSLTIALLVVFFYMISESIVFSRPLYIVLLTDITIVLARLYREKATRVLEESDGEVVEAHGDRHSWGDAVKLLERGLVVYQAIRGIFIDCSIYLVVVVCGISLM